MTNDQLTAAIHDLRIEAACLLASAARMNVLADALTSLLPLGARQPDDPEPIPTEPTPITPPLPPPPDPVVPSPT